MPPRPRVFRNCTLESLADWLRQTPGKRVVPDVKGDTPTAPKVIAARYPDLVDRFVVQIYQPEDYPLARAPGFDEVTWALYRYAGDDDDGLLWLRHMDHYGLSLPEPDARHGPALRAPEGTGVLSWAHRINDPQVVRDLKARGISEVMTDGLAPNDPG
jgi:glycerophosphoryl diester phosphodiesterase